jgi:hypothetical protein
MLIDTPIAVTGIYDTAFTGELEPGEYGFSRGLAGALKPFAEYATSIDGNHSSRNVPDTAHIAYAPDVVGGERPTVGDCRQAARLLQEIAGNSQ